MLKGILTGLGVLLLIAAGVAFWAYRYYVAYDPDYRSAYPLHHIDVYPEIHGGHPTPVLEAIITPPGEIWALVPGESCGTVTRMTATATNWGDYEAVALAADLFAGPGDCAGVGGVSWFVTVPMTLDELAGRRLSGRDGTPVHLTDCRKPGAMKRGSVCLVAAFPGGSDEPGVEWGVHLPKRSNSTS